MHPSFKLPDLLAIFREGLVALIPVAERARIAWREPRVWDPWEDIERALFDSIVASVVDNAVPDVPRPLPKYGSACPGYAALSFVTERSARLRGERLVFSRLISAGEPFDTMRFLEVDAGFAPAGRTMEIALAAASPELAARFGDGLRYCDTVSYRD